MKPHPLAATAALLLALASPALADGAAAVIAIEDNQLTEDIGMAAYMPFLTQSGVYKKVWKFTGRQRSNERLAAAIKAAAREHDVVDVFLAVHTTDRPTQTMLSLIPAEARKLRLVYSTACYGADVERDAWERLGAKTVVTHVGINNPLVAMPYFLSQWIRGEKVRETIEAGWREEAITTRFALSLPGVAPVLNAMYGENGQPAFLTGSRPVLSGRGDLTIKSGLRRARLRKPNHLRFSRTTGSSLGLALRAMAGNYEIEGGRLSEVMASLRLPAMPFLAPDLLRRIKVVPVYRNEPGGSHHSGRDRELRAGKVEVKLASKQVFPLEQGFELKVSKTVTITPGRVDPEKRTMKLNVSGLWVCRGALKYRVTSATIQPDGSGYEIKVGGGAWGFIPYWHSLPIGGTRPQPMPADLSILDARDHNASTVGLAGLVAPTQR